MRWSDLVLAAAAGALSGFGQGAPTVDKYTLADIDSGKAINDLSKIAFDRAMARLEKGPLAGGCSKETVRVRKEWRQIPGPERIQFRQAMECLMHQPPLYKDVPGAKTAYDDFAVLHYYYTPVTHFSATFLHWHRYYIWTFEDALRKQCNYTGTFPYWEWGLDAADMELSPVFDGSPTSLGGNGEKPKGRRPPSMGGTRGTGGGCVTKGPFSNFTVNLGPFERASPLDYNPRCLKRDLNTMMAARWASIRNTTQVILESPDIGLLQANMQGDGRYREAMKWGIAVHGGGHFAISGDPGGDFYFSPLEPGFWLHHGQIDRMHFVWQYQDWENRKNAIEGTGTMYDYPPSPNATLDDIMEFSALNQGNPKIGEVLDTLNAPMCYVYA